MAIEKDPAWQEIQEYRRKGVSLAEFWQFILDASPRQEAWIRHVSRSALDFKMWQFLMEPSRICFLELWEKSHPTIDFTGVLWEEIVRFILVPRHIHREALKYLAELGTAHPDALHFLTQSLQDEDTGVRRKALEILRKMGSNATEAIPFIIQALRDPNPEIQQRASLALMEIGGDSIEEALLKKPDLMNESQRRQAIQILGQIKSTKSIELLLHHLIHDDSPKVRAASAWALGKIGILNDPIAQSLLKGIQDLDDRVRAEAAQSLGDLSAISAIAHLLPLLQDSATFVQMAALQSLKIMIMKNPEMALLHLKGQDLPETLKNQIVPLLKRRSGNDSIVDENL